MVAPRVAAAVWLLTVAGAGCLGDDGSGSDAPTIATGPDCTVSLEPPSFQTLAGVPTVLTVRHDCPRGTHDAPVTVHYGSVGAGGVASYDRACEGQGDGDPEDGITVACTFPSSGTYKLRALVPVPTAHGLAEAWSPTVSLEVAGPDTAPDPPGAPELPAG